jgi:hypothetical protein
MDSGWIVISRCIRTSEGYGLQLIERLTWWSWILLAAAQRFLNTQMESLKFPIQILHRRSGCQCEINCDEIRFFSNVIFLNVT